MVFPEPRNPARSVTGSWLKFSEEFIMFPLLTEGVCQLAYLVGYYSTGEGFNSKNPHKGLETILETFSEAF